MEKQQEILFSIVSESKNKQTAYSPFSFQGLVSNVLTNQIDPITKVNEEQKPHSPTASAFKPSRSSQSGMQPSVIQVTPVSNKPSNPSIGLLGNGVPVNNLSHIQLLSELCSNIINKHL